MTLQEILTYVEELAFKNAMFGYDKDEVDIQLDKICDEVEALVTQKDKDIEELKRALSIANSSQDGQAEAAFSADASRPAYVDEGEEISRADYDAAVLECTQLKISLEQALADVATAREEAAQSDEAAKMLVSQIDSTQDMLTEAQEKARGLEAEVESLKKELAQAQSGDIDGQIAALKEELAQARQAAMEADALREELAEAREAVAAAKVAAVAPAEEAEEPAPVPVPMPAAGDDAQATYLRYADLLCKQLEENQVVHGRIVEEANAEAEEIRSAAQAEADKLLEDAQNVFVTRNAEAEEKVQGILADARTEAEEIISRARTEAEEVSREFMASAAVAEEHCKAMTEKKESLVASLSGFGDEIAALIARMTAPAAAEEAAAEEAPACEAVEEAPEAADAE